MTRPDANERYTVEVVTEVLQRRRWNIQEKMRIVEESFHPGKKRTSKRPRNHRPAKVGVSGE